MNMNTKIETRLLWIDWAKTISIYFIVLGHFYPGLIKSFIYSFHLPVFLIISGLLSHRQNTFPTKKLLKTLVIPYFIINILNYIFYTFISHTCPDMYHLKNEYLTAWFIPNILFGFHGIDGFHQAMGCAEMWFVYTLLFIKITTYYIKTSRGLLLYSLLCMAICYIYNRFNFNPAWAISNIFIASPFYCIGKILAEKKMEINIILTTMNKTMLLIMCLLFFGFQYIGSRWNSVACVVIGEYGNYLLLFYLLGITGCIWVFLISSLLSRYLNCNSIKIISSGTIVILGFHMLIVKPFLFYWFDQLNLSRDIYCYLIAALIVIVFIPIIKLTKRYVPILLGR